MCVILICRDSKPSHDVLKKCEEANPDGAGVAWRTQGGVEWLKGLTASEVYKLTKELDLPLVIHFRLSTVGGNIPELCHPFPITATVPPSLGGTAKAVLFHNGHWSDWRKYLLQLVMLKGEKLPPGPWSDSRAIAWLCHRHTGSICELIENSRICLFSKRQILLHGTFIEDKGIVYSNKNFELDSARRRNDRYMPMWYYK